MKPNRRALIAGGMAAVALQAVPAMAADQTKMVQEAINAAERDGGVVKLPSGTYRVSTLTIAASLTFAAVDGPVVLQPLSAAVTPLLKIGFEKSTIPNVVISGLIFDGGGSTLSAGRTVQGKIGEAGQALLSASQCSDLRIENCIFRNSRMSGVYLDACTGRIANNQFFKHDQAGVVAGRFNGTYASQSYGAQKSNQRGLEITGNRLHELGNGGIYIVHSGATADEDSSIITNNHIEMVLSGSGDGPNGNGIDVYNAANVIVSNNRITDCAYGGVRVVSSKNIQVIGNNLSRISDNAIFVEFAFEGVVVANNVIDDVTGGIELSGGENVVGRVAVCANNIVRNVNRSGTNPEVGNRVGIDLVSVASSCVGNVVENVATNAQGPGIGILVADWDASHYHLVQANIIKGAACGIGIPYGSGQKTISIQGNTIVGAVHNVAMLEQVMYPSGAAKSLTPNGGDLIVNNNQQGSIFLANNVTLK